MLQYVDSPTKWAELVFAPGSPPRVEGQHLDFKAAVNANDADIALPIAAFANAAGGVVAYGAIESVDPTTGLKVCTGTRDVGDPQQLARRIVEVAKSHLGEVSVLAVPLVVASGHRVLALNVPPSIPLVGCVLPAEATKIRYAERRGEQTVYLQPHEVEQRILSYRARGARLALEAWRDVLETQTVRVVHLVDGRPCELAAPDPNWIDFKVKVALSDNPLSFRLQIYYTIRESPTRRTSRQSKVQHVDIPYAFLAEVWAHKRSVDHSGVALLLTATVGWESSLTQPFLIPQPWPR